MARKHANFQAAPAPAPAGGDREAPPDQSAELTALLRHVEQLLEAGKPQQALDLLARKRLVSLWVTNATSVCLLRLGKPAQAMEVLRGEVVAAGGFSLKKEVPAALKVNFSTALLLSGNVSGCLSTLAEIPEQDHPGVRALREAIARWRQSHTLLEKVSWWLGSDVNRPVVLDYPPGVLR